MAKDQEVKSEVTEEVITEEVVSKEEYDKVKAELDALKSLKTEAKQDKTIENSKKLMEEKVKILIRRTSQSDDDVFVSINGKPLRIKRGVEVEIPKAYALVLEQSAKQQEYALDYAIGISENSEF